MPLEPFSIRANPKTMKELGKIAKSMDRSRNWLINEALENYLREQKWYHEQVAASRVEIKEGKMVSHDEAMDEIQKVIDDASKKGNRSK